MINITKYFFLLACLVIIGCTSCNTNTSNNTGTGNPAIPESEKKLRNVVNQYPDSLLAKENLIQYFRENGNYGQAISETEMALKKDSANDRLWDIKATLQIENGDTGNAIKAFEKAIEINPQPPYILSLGSLYAQTKNPLALAMADGLLQAPKANAQKQALFIKGLYYSYTGDKIKALSFFDICLQIDYRDMLAYREKAICLYDLQKYTEAIQVLQKSITIQQTFDEGYYWLGRCYEKLGKRKEAIENYQLALQIDPDFIEAKDALGKMGVTL